MLHDPVDVAPVPASAPGPARVRRVAVVGSGSAGSRHLLAVARLRRDVPVDWVVRPERDHPAHVGTLPEAVQVVDSVAEAARHRPGLGVVASPSPWHREHAEALLDAGATVLVEKPLAASLADAEALAAHPRAAEHLVLGYHLRWGDDVAVVRDAVAGAIGTPTGFHLDVRQHLSGWRPAVDPSQSVSARAELGGGVLRELSHELDALRFLLGEVAEVTARLRFDGAPTDGQVDTIADLDVVLVDGARGTVHLDMASTVPLRRWSVVGDGGRVDGDLLLGRVVVARDGHDDEVTVVAPDQRARCEDRLVEHALAVAEAGIAPACTAADGVAAVAIVAAALESHRTGGPVAVPPAPAGGRGAGPVGGGR